MISILEKDYVRFKEDTEVYHIDHSEYDSKLIRKGTLGKVHESFYIGTTEYLKLSIREEYMVVESEWVETI